MVRHVLGAGRFYKCGPGQGVLCKKCVNLSEMNFIFFILFPQLVAFAMATCHGVQFAKLD